MQHESEPDQEAQDKPKVSTNEDRRATYEEGMGKNLTVAPAELLEIVPLVVEVVRRYTSSRGNLGWLLFVREVLGVPVGVLSFGLDWGWFAISVRHWGCRCLPRGRGGR